MVGDFVQCILIEFSHNYGVFQFTNLAYNINKQLTSTRGYTLNARTAKRFPGKKFVVSISFPLNKLLLGFNKESAFKAKI